MEMKQISAETIRSSLPVLKNAASAALRNKLPPKSPTDGLRAAIAAAAVLDEFEPRTLVAAIMRESGDKQLEAASKICELSSRFDGGGSKDRWKMRSAERRRIIAQLLADGDAAETVQRIADQLQLPVNKVLAGYLRGETNPAAALSVEQLKATFGAFDLLRDLPENKAVQADAAEAASRLGREDLLASLRMMAGRLPESAHVDYTFLSEYVGPLNHDRYSSSTEGSEFKPFVIHGPAGIGKTAAIARFLLHDVLQGDVPRCPFSYLNFGRASLSVLDPVRILHESLRQLSAFYPSAYTLIQRTRASWVRDIVSGWNMEHPRSDTVQPHFSEDSSAARLYRRLLCSRFQWDFCCDARFLGPRGTPFVLILDGFERVQGERDLVVGLRHFLTDLDSLTRITRHPLRVIVSGRKAIPELSPATYYIATRNDFDLDSLSVQRSDPRRRGR